MSVSRIIEQDSTNAFQVITRDKDLGDPKPYPRILDREWNQVGKALVAYIHVGLMDLLWITRQIRHNPPDIYYFNSLQSPWFTLLPLIGLKTCILPKRDIIIAPRGEASVGAMKLKWRKKSFWRPIIKILVGAEATWHASSNLERDEIIRWWGSAPPKSHKIIVWPDPSVKPKITYFLSDPGDTRVIVFASRIDRMKGLHEAIEILAEINENFEFQIYGEITDQAYWEECRTLANLLLPSDTWSYKGSYRPSDAETIFSRATAFIFPTRGENFGHVIAESLAVGCPVVLSPTTLWTGVIDAGGGQIIDDSIKSALYLEKILMATPNETNALRREVQAAYAKWFNSHRKPNMELFK